MKEGETVLRGGYFTRAQYLRGQPSDEVERRLGYRSGRFASGWYLLFLMQMPAPDEFEFRGYTHLPDGLIQTKAGPRSAEDNLLDKGLDLARLKTQAIATSFRLEGYKRLAKAIPMNEPFGENDYPPGSGFPQWKLVRQKPFRVAAVIGPGEQYVGDYT